MHGVVYDPPRVGLPYLAVVLDNNLQVVVSRAVGSVAEGEALISAVFEDFAAAKNMGKF